MPNIVRFLLCLLAFPCFLNAQGWFSTGQNAQIMVSGVGFNQTGGLIFNHPNGLASDGTQLLVCDRFNNRLLVWKKLPTNPNTAPDLVLGQPNLDTNDPGTGKNQLNWPGNASLATDGKLAVADTENDRILLWNSFPVANGQAADYAIHLPSISPAGTGQFYGWPWGVWTDGKRLAAVATQGGAILFWNNFPTSDNVPPDYSIKLPQFGTPRTISTDGASYFFVGDHNAKVNGSPGTFFWNSYPVTANQPYDFYRDEWIKGQKLPDGKLVAGGLSKIYIWNSMPTGSGQSPDLALAPPSYKNGDGVDLIFAQNRLFVNNYNGNNILVFNLLPVNASQAPDFAIAAPTIVAQTLDSIYYVQNPVLVTDGTRLIASSDFDRALYIWDHFPKQNGQVYDHKIEMPNGQLWAATLHKGKLITGARNVLSVWDDAANISPKPTYQLVSQIGSALLDDIRGLTMDDHFFYLATKSGKIYLWSGLPTNATTNPVLTLSSTNSAQYGFLYSDGEYLCAARPEPPTGVDIYRVTDLRAGVVQPFKVISNGAVRLNQTAQGATKQGALFVASRADNRVLCWQNPADWGNPVKMIVLGQPNAQSVEAAIGRDRLFMPNSLLPHQNDLWVGEFKFSSRILKYSASTTPALEPFASTDIRVFPNPFSDHIFLKNAPVKARFMLCNATGQIVFDGENVEQANFSSLPAGIYFLRVMGERTVVVKLMKR